MTKKPLQFVVSGALLVGSMGACGSAEPPVNEPEPVVNEADPENENDPEVNVHPEHVHPETDPATNVEAEPELHVNEMEPSE